MASTQAVNNEFSSSSAAAGVIIASWTSWGVLSLDLDQELIAHGAEPPLHLAAALGFAGTAVQQPDPEHRAGRSSQLSTNAEPLST